MPPNFPKEFLDCSSNPGRPIEDKNAQGHSDKGFDAAHEHFFLSILTIQNVQRVVGLEKLVEEMLAARFWFWVKEGE